MMKKLSTDMYKLLNTLGCDESFIKKSQRAQQVRDMWSEIVEDFFLEHTNSIYILNEEGKKTLIVYVDESIFAAELNGRRELIKLQFLEKFGEDIDEFKIIISRGSYKKNYPFKEKIIPNYIDETPIISLTEEELNEVYYQTECIENEKVRASLLKAMIADLEWKKGINGKCFKKDQN